MTWSGWPAAGTANRTVSHASTWSARRSRGSTTERSRVGQQRCEHGLHVLGEDRGPLAAAQAGLEPHVGVEAPQGLDVPRNERRRQLLDEGLDARAEPGPVRAQPRKPRCGEIEPPRPRRRGRRSRCWEDRMGSARGARPSCPPLRPEASRRDEEAAPLEQRLAPRRLAALRGDSGGRMRRSRRLDRRGTGEPGPGGGGHGGERLAEEALTGAGGELLEDSRSRRRRRRRRCGRPHPTDGRWGPGPAPRDSEACSARASSMAARARSGWRRRRWCSMSPESPR